MYEKAANFGIFPKWVNRRKLAFRKSFHDLLPIVEKKRIGRDKSCFGTRLSEPEQRAVDIALITNLNNSQCHAERFGR